MRLIGLSGFHVVSAETSSASSIPNANTEVTLKTTNSLVRLFIRFLLE
jgi:hypothetical protein